MRLFVAIGLDPAHRAVLARLPARRSEAGVRLRCVAERNLHLTLKFLGEVDELLISGLIERLDAATSSVGRFDLECAGLECFPPRGAPRVLFARCDGGAALEGLRQRIDSRLEGLGFPVEHRPFHPHVTLARVEGRPLSALIDPKLSNKHFFVQSVASVRVMRSELHPDGAIHSLLAELKLAPENPD